MSTHIVDALGDRHTIRITIPPQQPDRAEVDRAFADLVEPLVSFPSITYVQSAKDGIEGQRVTASLGVRDGNVYRFPAKLFTWVGTGLAADGNDVHATLPIRAIPPPDYGSLAAAPRVVAQWFGNPGTWGGGLFVGDHGLRVRRDIPRILRVYAQRRVVLAVDNKNEAEWWVDQSPTGPPATGSADTSDQSRQFRPTQ